MAGWYGQRTPPRDTGLPGGAGLQAGGSDGPAAQHPHHMAESSRNRTTLKGGCHGPSSARLRMNGTHTDIPRMMPRTEDDIRALFARAAEEGWTELDLSREFDSADVQIGEELLIACLEKHAKTLVQLTSLDLSFNRVGPEGARAIAAGLARLTSRLLGLLCLVAGVILVQLGTSVSPAGAAPSAPHAADARGAADSGEAGDAGTTPESTPSPHPPPTRDAPEPPR